MLARKNLFILELIKNLNINKIATHPTKIKTYLWSIFEPRPKFGNRCSYIPYICSYKILILLIIIQYTPHSSEGCSRLQQQPQKEPEGGSRLTLSRFEKNQILNLVYYKNAQISEHKKIIMETIINWAYNSKSFEFLRISKLQHLPYKK